MRAAEPAGRGARLLVISCIVGLVSACGFGSHLHPPPDRAGIQGNFGIDQSESGSWGEYGTREGAGRFEFSIDPLSLQPGEPVYAPVALRTLPTVTTPVTIMLRPPLTTPNSVAGVLRYSVSEAPASSCNAGGFGSPTVVDGQPLTATGGSLMLEPKVVRTLCFRVEIPAGTPPHDFAGLADTVALWEFRAEGEDPPRPPKPAPDRCHSHSGPFVFGGGWYFVHCWFLRRHWGGTCGWERAEVDRRSPRSRLSDDCALPSEACRDRRGYSLMPERGVLTVFAETGQASSRYRPINPTTTITARSATGDRRRP